MSEAQSQFVKSFAAVVKENPPPIKTDVKNDEVGSYLTSDFQNSSLSDESDSILIDSPSDSPRQSETRNLSQKTNEAEIHEGQFIA